MIKLFMLSYIDSIHTKRWITALSKENFKIYLFGLNHADTFYYEQFANVEVYNYTFKSSSFKIIDWVLGKVGYLRASQIVKKKIAAFEPDIVHSHYATSYGLLGSMSGFHPFVLSVWGSDVYGSPKLSALHMVVLKYNLSKADKILSTSGVMARETNRYTSKNIVITPFGVDLDLFKKNNSIKHRDSFVIGNVKSLQQIYGIDILIKAFKILVMNNPSVNLTLQIAGKGPEEKKLKKLSEELGIINKVDFIGFIEHSELPKIYNGFDVAVFLSNKESFGVAAIEAMACECPVVVSDAEGFTEIVSPDYSGFIVPKQNPDAAAAAIQVFIDNRSLITEMGTYGRKQVEKFYDWNENVKQMINIYQKMTTKNR